YNGEVYNYVELRRELNTPDGGWRSETDTEVVLEAIQHWGPGALDRFNGMFAFAIWNPQTHELFCGRDRFGVKPFHYFWDGRHLLFASELKAVVAGMRLLGFEVRADISRVSAFLHGLPPRDLWQSFIGGVRHLPPGSYLRLGDGTLRIQRYYDLEKAVEAER